MKSSKKSKIMNCLHCSKEVNVPQHRYDSFRFCSRKCNWNYKEANNKKNIICRICSKEFLVISYREKTARYCSHQCYSKAKFGSVIKLCAQCKNEMVLSPSHLKQIYCSRKCRSIFEQNNFDNRNMSFQAVRMHMKKAKLLNKCMRCGYNIFPQIIGIHHKDRNRKNNRISNLEALCPNCHSIEHLCHTPHGFKE